MYGKRRNAPVTDFLILVNVLVFLYVALHGGLRDDEILLRLGASYTPYLTEKHEYWRLLTAAFLHFGIRHLGNNMFVLFVTGDSLEHALGHVKYLIFYLFSAVGASAASLAVEVAMGQKVLSAGASGAVFAVLGGLIWVLIRNSGRFEEFRIRNLLFFSGMMLLSGFFTEGVDNAAHAGGLLVGFLLAVVLYRRPAVTLFSTDMT
ncbi:rhomboid family intramembrane serine protease [Stomatobaculum sp. F0698]|uniref:rhomboid family intramembrane serine protease n=1 Tax=Stomatobaculum sp. F0698 TaxID=3059030 RepID=UPI00272B3B1B|nr:rhomboid family intramembrane serine protease [Stomatobaculum sp. F0698]WLD86600.1 rhomboid family intramembrane serine protease [Stomatobaculum sp. F0698]